MKPTKIKNYASKVVSQVKGAKSKVDAERKNFGAGDLEYVAQKADEYERARQGFDDPIGRTNSKKRVSEAAEYLGTTRGIAADNYKKPKQGK